MKKVVITGGAGFIGSALTRAALASSDAQVVIIDSLLTGKRENLAEIRSQVDFHQADIRDYDAIAPLVAGADVLFHLAAIPSVPRSIHEPVLSHEVNLDGTFNVFRASHEGGVRRVVYARSEEHTSELQSR